MSLATRCTACGTIFRVVQDQLRVSDGWVRCGRCAEVFDAREQLFDLDREAPPPWPPAGPDSAMAPPAEDAFAPPPPPRPAPRAAAPVMPPAPSPAPPPPAMRPAFREPEAPAGVFHEQARWPEEETGQPPQPTWAEPVDHPGDRREPFWEPPAAPTATVDSREDLPEPKGLRFEEPASPTLPAGTPATQDLGPDVVLSPRLQASQAEAPVQQAEAAMPSPEAPAAAMRKPGFLRRAEGEARWQRPGVRLALGLGSLLLTLGAVAQLTWHYRDALATQSPLARQWLGDTCEKLGCELQPWRRLDAFSVESTGLSEAASGNHYKFSLSLRNKSPWELATPWVELSLNDGNGKVLMKRALKPEDFANGRASTAANSEQALQLVFGTGRQRVNGYTVEIFYP